MPTTNRVRRSGARAKQHDTRRTVLFAIPSLSRGGASRQQGGPEGVFLSLLTHFDRDRFDVHLVVDDAAECDLLDEIGAETTVHSLNERLAFRLPGKRYPAAALAAVARGIRPDVILSTLRMNATCSLARPLLPADTFTIARLANNVSGSLDSQRRVRSAQRVAAARWLHRLVMRRSTHVVAQSRAMERDVVDQFGPWARQRLSVIPNPVDIDGLQARAVGASPDTFAEGRPHIVSVGRLHHQKGYDLLLPAFARLLDSWPSATLRILGEGPDRHALEEQADSLDIAQHLDLHGFVQDPVPHVSVADLYVCTSRYEGFSNALAEALAVGLPAVAPSGPAAAEDLLVDGNPTLVPDLDQVTLTQAMAAALQGRVGRQAEIAERYRWLAPEKVARMYERMIDDVIT